MNFDGIRNRGIAIFKNKFVGGVIILSHVLVMTMYQIQCSVYIHTHSHTLNFYLSLSCVRVFLKKFSLVEILECLSLENLCWVNLNSKLAMFFRKNSGL